MSTEAKHAALFAAKVIIALAAFLGILWAPMVWAGHTTGPKALALLAFFLSVIAVYHFSEGVARLAPGFFLLGGFAMVRAGLIGRINATPIALPRAAVMAVLFWSCAYLFLRLSNREHSKGDRLVIATFFAIVAIGYGMNWVVTPLIIGLMLLLATHFSFLRTQVHT